jgi:hypothetical protein
MPVSESRQHISHRLGLLSILVAVAVAGIIVGYALAGLNDVSPIIQADAPDTAPLLEAIATSVAPNEPTATPTPNPNSDLPACTNPGVSVGDLCLPVSSPDQPCPQDIMFMRREDAVPCRKSEP